MVLDKPVNNETMFDANGTVTYTGQNNDRDIILQNIGGVVPTNTRVEQMP
jgi:hypothetical protein